MGTNTIFCCNCGDTLYDNIFGWTRIKCFSCKKCNYSEVSKNEEHRGDVDHNILEQEKYVVCFKCVKKVHHKCPFCNKKLDIQEN